MNPRHARLLTRLYPRAWKERYADEFEALLETSKGGIRTLLNIVESALFEHIFRMWRRKMNTNPYSFGAIVRKPSAFLPIAMSLCALAVIFITFTYGFTQGHWPPQREPDEGTAAHLWQLLMAGQFPVLAFFAVKWLPKAPKQSLYVLALQVGAALSAMAPVFYFNL